MPKHLSVNQAKLLNQHRYILKKLASVDVKTRQQILKNAPADLFKTLNLIFKMISSGQIQLTKKQEDKIKRHKGLIRRSSELKSTAIKRKLQNQRGGFLPAILSAALPIIGSIIKSVL